jgi:hypothetical protein
VLTAAERLLGLQHPACARFEISKRALDLLTSALNGLILCSSHFDWLTDHNRHAAERLWHLRTVPASDSPGRSGLDVKGKDGMASRASQECRTRLGDSSGPAWSCTSARTPPREDDPRAVPYPKRRMIRAIHSPSKFRLVITTIPRSRKW